MIFCYAELIQLYLGLCNLQSNIFWPTSCLAEYKMYLTRLLSKMAGIQLLADIFGHSLRKLKPVILPYSVDMPENHLFGCKSGDIDKVDNLSENYKTLVGNDFEHKVKFRIGH